MYLLLLILFGMTSDCATPMCVTDLKKMLRAEGKGDLDNDETIRTNFALVYYLSNDKVVLLPNSMSDETMGLLFDSKKCLLECLEKDSYPIQNDNLKLEEFYQDEINNLDSNINEIIGHLLSCLKLNIPIQTVDSSSLSFLLYKLRENKEHLGEKENFYSWLILGEYIRIKKKGKWILIKRHGQFNPFFDPAILYPDNNILFHSFFSNFLESSYTLENYLNFGYIKNPSFKITQWKNGYKILD